MYRGGRVQGRVCTEEGMYRGGCVQRRVCTEEGVYRGGHVQRRVCTEEGVCRGGCMGMIHVGRMRLRPPFTSIERPARGRLTQDIVTHTTLLLRSTGEVEGRNPTKVLYIHPSITGVY